MDSTGVVMMVVWLCAVVGAFCAGYLWGWKMRGQRLFTVVEVDEGTSTITVDNPRTFPLRTDTCPIRTGDRIEIIR